MAQARGRITAGGRATPLRLLPNRRAIDDISRFALPRGRVLFQRSMGTCQRK